MFKQAFPKHLVSGFLLVLIGVVGICAEFPAITLSRYLQLVVGCSSGLLITAGVALVFRAGQLDVAEYHSIPKGTYPLHSERVPLFRW